MVLRKLRSLLEDALAPPICSGCGERGTWTCARCLTEWPTLDSLPSLCRRCGQPMFRGECGCKNLHPRIGVARSAYPFGGWVRTAIHGMKYDGEKDRAMHLGPMLATSAASPLLRSADYIVPVPMHWRKLRERGYNQAELLATGVANELDIAAPVPLLAQHDMRPSQVGLSARERRVNLRGAISLAEGWSIRSGARIVLVDDVRTTGATLSACAAALGRCAPARIDVVTFAAELTPDVWDYVGLTST